MMSINQELDISTHFQIVCSQRSSEAHLQTLHIKHRISDRIYPILTVHPAQSHRIRSNADVETFTSLRNPIDYILGLGKAFLKVSQHTRKIFPFRVQKTYLPPPVRESLYKGKLRHSKMGTNLINSKTPLAMSITLSPILSATKPVLPTAKGLLQNIHSASPNSITFNNKTKIFINPIINYHNL